MRLATYVDPSLSFDARFGIISGDHIVDVVAVADTLHRAVPATSVKIALTSGAQTLSALGELVAAAEKAKLLRPLPGVTFLPPIADPSKFFCVGKNNKKHREELAANKMLTEVPNEPTGFIKLVSTMSVFPFPIGLSQPTKAIPTYRRFRGDICSAGSSTPDKMACE